MLGCAAMLLDKALNFFEASNDALLAGRASCGLFGWSELGQLVCELVQIRAAHIDHPP
ncbi:hypothetical protein D9M68_946870 [compost metagenome]